MNIRKYLSFRGLLYNKKFTVSLAILLSFALWIVITVNSKTTMDRTFTDLNVSVNMDRTFASESNMSIINDISAQKFSVSVIGPNSVVSSLQASDIKLYASAAQVDAPGEYELTVSVSQAAGGDYDVISITPKTLNVSFDYVETREFTITASAEGITAADGLIVEPAAISGIDGNTISITGARTVINKIETVQANANAEKTLSTSETFDAELVLLDKNGKTISAEGLQFSVEKVQVTVPISKSKTVPVVIDLSNTPDGFDKTCLKYTVDHSEVTVIGTPETVDKISEVTLSAIDISKLTKSETEFETAAKLPEGVRLLDTIEKFKVTFDLSNYREKVITVSNLKFTDLSSGLKTADQESIKNVRILYPYGEYSKITDDTVYATVSLKDKKAGAHAVKAQINFDDTVRAWAVGEYQTSVTIK